MDDQFPDRGLFITGTDTEVGKTFVTALLARTLVGQGHAVGVYKPAASGCIEQDGRRVAEDALLLREAAGLEVDLESICPQQFTAPLAPHLAAMKEDQSVQPDLLRSGLAFWKGRCDIVLVEGIGGLMSPVSDEDYVADLAYDFGYPLIVVSPNTLGVINQTLQTLITASSFRDGLPIAGVVLNDARMPVAEQDPSVASNRRQLEEHCVPPLLAHVGHRADTLGAEVDWFALGDAHRR